MYMYYFDKQLREKAEKLIHKSKDLADIAQYTQRIIEVLNYPTHFSIQYMQSLDNEIKARYPDIRLFQGIADSIKWKTPIGSSNQQHFVYEIEALKFDLFYLYALALFRSGEIVEYMDFFDKNYIE